MCGSDGSFDIPNDRTKIAFTGETCADFLFVKEAELNTCLDITKYQTLCECPNAPAAPGTCILCGDGQEFRNAGTMVDAFGTTCQQNLGLRTVRDRHGVRQCHYASCGCVLCS
jgi:hypothetical protein